MYKLNEIKTINSVIKIREKSQNKVIYLTDFRKKVYYQPGLEIVQECRV